MRLNFNLTKSRGIGAVVLTLVFFIQFQSCVPNKEQVDAIYYNANIYTVNENFEVLRGAVAIKDGKFVALDSTHRILLAYDAPIKEDLNEQYIYPGFYDAHCHFLGYAKSLFQVNLTQTNSYAEVLEKVYAFDQNQPDLKWITGRGWDQNDWENKAFPTNAELNARFPNKPVLIRRVDGHAAIANKKALDLAGITAGDTISGGIIETKNGVLTGLLVDNAVDIIMKVVPQPDNTYKSNALLKAQQNCFEVGLTTVDDAGLDIEDILMIDSLQKTGKLKMHIYAMLNPGKNEFDFASEKGFYQTDQLNVRSFKVYADGALGSRGACLKSDYNDRTGHSGFLLSAKDSLSTLAEKIHQLGFQMNTHCIGDSANGLLLNICGKYSNGNKNMRWRIEHAQVVDSADMDKFGKYGVIPSVQPTHCTSDMYWAEERLGTDRIKGAYAYKTLLEQYGKIAAGSDFPVEGINPLFGFYAAVSRKDQHNYPKTGFQMKDAISRENALRAMTIWAAFSNFEEEEKGSIEVGKRANMVVMQADLLTAPENELFALPVIQTIIDGELVFNAAAK